MTSLLVNVTFVPDYELQWDGVNLLSCCGSPIPSTKLGTILMRVQINRSALKFSGFQVSASVCSSNTSSSVSFICSYSSVCPRPKVLPLLLCEQLLSFDLINSFYTEYLKPVTLCLLWARPPFHCCLCDPCKSSLWSTLLHIVLRHPNHILSPNFDGTFLCITCPPYLPPPALKYHTAVPFSLPPPRSGIIFILASH